ITSLPRGSDLPGHAAPQELAHAFLAEPLGAVDDQLAAQEDSLDPPRDRPALEHRVVDPTVTLRGSDGPGFVGIEQDDVRIRADGDRALPGKQAEEPGARGPGPLVEADHREPPPPAPAADGQRRARL